MSFVRVVSGDAVRIPTEALVAPVNSGKIWNGAIDRAIRGVAGDAFHDMIRDERMEDGTACIVSGVCHQGMFEKVIFVVDDLKRPLREIVLVGLLGAEYVDCRFVLLPTMRMGYMAGQMETPDQALDEMVAGVRDFLKEKPDSRLGITFVVYKDEGFEGKLRGRMREAFPWQPSVEDQVAETRFAAELYERRGDTVMAGMLRVQEDNISKRVARHTSTPGPGPFFQ